MKSYFLVAFLILSFSEFAHSQGYSLAPAWFKTYDVKFYSINLNVSDTNTVVSGNTLVKLEIKEPTDSIVFQFNPDLVIDSILINKKNVKSFHYQSDLLIIKDILYSVNSSLDIKVFYNGNVSTNTFFSSVSNEYDNYWNIPATWSLSESFGAKYWFPCKQQLTDKADSCWVFLTIPKGRKAGSVGVLTDTVDVGNNRVQYQWKTKYPIVYYLISFTVADYNDYSFYTKFEGRNDSLLVQNYLYNRPGYLEINKNEIDKTSDFLKLYSKLFGLYPFYNEKYGHCVAPISGGMEHQTMTTLANFSYTLVAHELAHQWFGDNTTCATWQDIWVNEGFASYCEYLAYEFLASKAEADSWMRSAQMRALKEPEGSVFVPASESANEYRIFSSNLSYKKGAVILHMLRKQINNDTLFFRSLRSYLSEFRYASATAEDFKKVVEKETGIDLGLFFNQWYYGKGYPQFDLSWKFSNDSLFLNVNQTPSSQSIAFFNTPFEIKAIGLNYDTTLRLHQITNPQLFKIKLNKTISQVEFDPDNWLLKVVQNINNLPEIPSVDDYFEVKPNPFNGDLYIIFKEIPAKDEKIQIVGLNGSVVSEILIRKKKETIINTASLKPGIYLLVVRHGQEKLVRKIVKTNIY